MLRPSLASISSCAVVKVSSIRSPVCACRAWSCVPRIPHCQGNKGKTKRFQDRGIAGATSARQHRANGDGCHCAPSRRARLHLHGCQYQLQRVGAAQRCFCSLACPRGRRLYTPHELQRILNDAGATLLVVLANVAHNAAAILSHTPVRAVVVTQVGDLLGWFRGSLINLVVRHLKQMVKPHHFPVAVGLRDVLRKGGALARTRPALPSTFGADTRRHYGDAQGRHADPCQSLY